MPRFRPNTANRVRESRNRQESSSRRQNEIDQGLEAYSSGEAPKLTLAGKPEEREQALAGLNLSNILYGQNIFDIGKDVQGIKSQYEQRAKGMDPISAAVQAQKQGALASSRNELARQGIKGGAALRAQDAIARSADRAIASSLYGQQGSALNNLRTMASNMASGTTSQMYASQAAGTPVPAAPAEREGLLSGILGWLV